MDRTSRLGQATTPARLGSVLRFLSPVILLVALVVLTANAQAQPQFDVSAVFQPLGSALRNVLSERGFMEDDIDDVLNEVGAKMVRTSLVRGFDNLPTKRAGWKKILVEPRFAPFGTKLLPSTNRVGNSGPALLRYGRGL